jgi:hypothetical protein
MRLSRGAPIRHPPQHHCAQASNHCIIRLERGYSALVSVRTYAIPKACAAAANESPIHAAG